MRRMYQKISLAIFILFFMTSISQAAEIRYKEGDKGLMVAAIQSRLTDSGFAVPKIDGTFNRATVKAVQAFQSSNRLPVSGVVEGNTYAKLMTRVNTGIPASPAYRAADAAFQYYGKPYKYGGQTPATGFDCSGLISYVFAEQGKKLPRTADLQYKTGKIVAVKDLQIGDLVFFTTDEPGPSHVGIFVGQNRFIHASSSRGVMVSSLSDIYWKPRYLGARRVP